MPRKPLAIPVTTADAIRAARAEMAEMAFAERRAAAEAEFAAMTLAERREMAARLGERNAILYNTAALTVARRQQQMDVADGKRPGTVVEL